jgi:hypothetical protein
MTAEIITWRDCVMNPNDPAMATLKDFPTAQTLPAAQQQSVAQNKLIAAGDALTNGMFYVTPASQSTNVGTLGLGGTTVTTSQLFDMTLLDEIYAARSDLKSVPAQGTI